MPGVSLRRLYDGVGRACHLAGLHRIEFAGRDAVVMYHSVRDPDRIREHTSDITVAQLRRHLAYFDRQFDIVDLDEIRPGGGDAKRVALTFDDGHRDFYTNVLPVLREFDAPATAFVVTDFLDDANRREQVMNTGHLYDALTTDQVHDLAASDLVRVGNHTRTHHDLGAHAERDILEAEIVGAKRGLEERFGVTVDRFCYPNGGYNEASLDIVRESHDLATTDESMRPVFPDDDPVLLPRVDGGLPFPLIQWRLSDPNGALVRRGRTLLQ